MFDLIGDIHGHADALERLLTLLGYRKIHNYYKHPERKALFLGDYIDRGPYIRETLHLVRSMVENEAAIALMGNHEYNALCFHFHNPDGGHLRRHSLRNIYQHFATIQQFLHHEKEYEDFLEWFFSLPLWYEDEQIRAVHACWNLEHIHFLQNKLNDRRLTPELLYESAQKGTNFYHVIDDTLKGIEIPMPEGLYFFDKDGIKRTKIRIKWWENPKQITLRQYSVLPLDMLPDEPLSVNHHHLPYYSEHEKPVFFGHYWMKGAPHLLKPNVCCLDFSVAKGGYLAAYRFHGEEKLLAEHLTFVPSNP